MPDAPRASLPLRSQLPPIIGRERQLALLAEYLAYLRHGSGGHPVVVLLSGAAGIGKTRLLEEISSPQFSRDITVLRGSASQAEGMPPYLPFLEALGDYVSAVPIEQLRAQVETRAAILSTLLPEIADRLGPPAPMPPLPPEQERFRLFEAIAAFITAIAAHTPLLILLDDLHWVDAASTDLLVHLANRVRSPALLVVGASREGEAVENPSLTGALAELNRRRQLATLRLPPLAQQESRILTNNLLPGTLSPRAAVLLHTRAEGNPFFLEELVRALVDDGRLVERAELWDLAGDSGQMVPPRLAEAIQMRLARLDAALVELLHGAAVVGRTCSPALVASLMEIDVEQADEILLAATRAQVMRPQPDGTYAFVHDLVRETLSADLGPARRKRLHHAIGEWLVGEGQTESPRRLAELAFHFAEAGEADRGATYAVAAGRQALRASAPGEAVGSFQTAVRLLESRPDADVTRLAEAMTALGDAATQAGDYPRAAAAYQSTQAAWLRAGNSRQCAHAWRQLGAVRWRQEAVTEAKDAFDHAWRMLGPADDPDAAETLLQLADLHATSLGRIAEGSAYADRALAMIERLGERHLEARALCVLGNIKGRSNEVTAGRALLERALTLAEGLDDPSLGAEVCGYLANIHAWAGDLVQSRAVSLRRAEYARRTQDLFHLRHVYSWIGFQELLQGNWSEAERWLTRQEPVVAGLMSPEPAAAVHAYRGLLRYFLGRFAESEQDLATALALLHPTGSGTLVWYLGWQAQNLAELGRRDEALDSLAMLSSIAGSLDERSRARGNAYAQLTVGYARLRLREHAAACYPLLLPFQGQVSPVLIDRGLGAAARASGETARARQHFLDAETIARRAGMRPELALTLLQRGLLERDLAASADRSSAPDDPLTDGLRLCAELGIDELGRRLLRPLPARPPRVTDQDQGIAGLSPRELDVLRLVAQGLTNREIASSLFLSEKTVARHLTNIFGKIGVTNRAGATAFALLHGVS